MVSILLKLNKPKRKSKKKNIKVVEPTITIDGKLVEDSKIRDISKLNVKRST